MQVARNLRLRSTDACSNGAPTRIVHAHSATMAIKDTLISHFAAIQKYSESYIMWGEKTSFSKFLGSSVGPRLRLLLCRQEPPGEAKVAASRLSRLPPEFDGRFCLPRPPRRPDSSSWLPHHPSCAGPVCPRMGSTEWAACGRPRADLKTFCRAHSGRSGQSRMEVSSGDP